MLIPLLAQDVLDGDADTYGFLMAASGVGSLVSRAGHRLRQRPTMRLLLAGAAVIGVALLGLSLVAPAGRPRAHVRRRLGHDRHGRDD